MNRLAGNIIVLTMLLVIGGGIYSNSLQNGYHFDDIHHIVKNQYLTSPGNIPLFFKEGRTFSDDPEFQRHYRPLVLTSYALNYYFGKLKPSGYHLVNLAFHVGSAFLIFLLVQAMLGGGERFIRFFASLRMTDGFFPALAAGLIFLTTPFNSEVVNYISARSSVMCTFFYLLSFYCWVKYRSAPSLYYYVTSLLAFLLALLTKEIAVTLPVMIFVYDLYFPRENVIPAKAGIQNADRYPDSHLRGNDWVFSTIRSYVPYIPFVFLAGFIGLFLRKVLFDYILSGDMGHGREIAPQLLTGFRLTLKYLYMTLFPAGLSIEHPVEISISLWNQDVMISLVILTSLLALFYFLWSSSGRTARVISFMGVWFFITLLPTTIIPLNAMFQENRGYLSAAGIVGIAGIALSQGIHAARFREWTQPLYAYVLILALSLAYGWTTYHRNMVWTDDLALWGDVLKKYPDARSAVIELSKVKAMRDPEGAEEGLKKILEKDPANSRVINNLASLYAMSGRYELAEEQYLRAIEINPAEYVFHQNLARLYKVKGDRESAIKAYREVLRLAPDDTEAAGFLAGIPDAGENKGAGEKDLRKAVQEDPRNPANYRGLGVLYARQEKWGKAAEMFEKVLEITPDDVQTTVDLAAIYIKLGKPDLAEREFQHVLELEPKNRMAHQGLGILYQQQEQYDLSLKHYETAMEGKKASPRVLNNIGAIYLAKGDTEKAIHVFKQALEIDPSYDIVRTNLERAYKIQRGGKGG